MESKYFQDLSVRLDNLLDILRREKVKVEVREAEQTKLSFSIDEKRNVNIILLQVVELFKSLGGVREKEILEKLEHFVSYGLSAVFGLTYSFITNMRLEGKELRVDFQIKTGNLQSDVLTAKGGGVAEVVSLLLQIFFVVMLKDNIAPLLVLDTVLLHLSSQYHDNMSALLKEIVSTVGIQMVILANRGTYGGSADVVYKFEQVAGKTVVKREK